MLKGRAPEAAEIKAATQTLLKVFLAGRGNW